MSTIRRPALTERAAAALLVSLASATAFAQTTVQSTWVGDLNNHGGQWNNPSLWSPAGVPNNTATFEYDVTVDNDLNNGNGGSPSIEVPITINNLNLLNGGGIGANFNTSADFTVLGTTTITPEMSGGQTYYGGMEVRGSTYRLGTLATENFNNGVLTAGFLRIEEGAAAATLKFKGANIVENRAGISLFGAQSFIRDEDTELDALDNFATNAGEFELNGGRQFVTGGNFDNSGSLFILGDDEENKTLATLAINGNLTNSGSLHATSGARVLVTGNMSNSGSIRLEQQATLTVSGVLTQTAGTFMLGDDDNNIETFRATAERIDLAAGTTFGGRGTLLADLVEGGIFAPGASPGKITVQGDITFQNTADLQIEIAGTTAGTQFDQVAQANAGGDGTTLDGLLTITLINGFQTSITSADTFIVLTSDQLLKGAFDNVASGQRVAVAGGGGSFLVTYAGSTNVVLSNFQVPEPTVASIVLAAGGVACGRRRMRRATISAS